MAEFPAMPLWTDAYLGDTKHLTTIEHGAYLLLLIAMWRTKAKSLPNDDKLLARYAGLTPGQWRRIKPILWPFMDVKDGRVTQGRLTDEANAVRQHSKKQSDKAKARWLKNKESGDAAAMPDGCRTNATLTLTLNESKDSIDHFEEWWSLYPRKVSKGSARKAFKAALKKTDADALMAGVRSYAEKVRGKDAQYIAHAATWLNGERWLDSESSPGSQQSEGASLERRVEVAADWLSRNDSIPDWMDKPELADALLAAGHDYDRLRKVGFSLPPRGKVVDISRFVKTGGT